MTVEQETADPVQRSLEILRIEAALRRAVRAALLEHKRAGNPICVWEDGRVVWIAPEDIVVEDEPDA